MLLRSSAYYRVIFAVGILCAATISCSRTDGPPSGGTEPSLGGKKPNILFIVVDTLRADRLGAYGHPGLSPTIDAIAKEGVTFERCQSAASWTLPSVTSMFVSYFPSVHKANDYFKVEDVRSGRTKEQVNAIPSEFETLADVMKHAGYATAAFTHNPFMQPQWGFGRGFDVYEAAAKDAGSKGSDLNESVFKYLASRDKSAPPFFLYVHYMDVHGPYDAPAELMDPLMQKVEADTGKQAMTQQTINALHPGSYLRLKAPLGSDPTRYRRLHAFREYWMAGYDAGILEVDGYLAQLQARLKELNLWDDLLVVITSDHGEAFGVVRRANNGNDCVFWEHGGAQHQEQTRVPLIFRMPGVFKAGQRVPGNARLIDVKPTLALLLGVKNFDPGQGRSLLPMIAGKSSGAAFSLSESTKPRGYQQEAIIQGNLKLIRTRVFAGTNPMNGQPIKADTFYELYDLASDPDERKNLFGSDSTNAKRLIAALDKQSEANLNVKPGIKAVHTDVSGDISGALSAVGYVGDGKDSKNEREAQSRPASQSAATASSSSIPASLPTSQPDDDSAAGRTSP